MGEYTRDFDAVLLAYSVLKRLGAGKIDTFEQRLKSQKIQYIAQVFQISPRYRFNLYIRGPYSSQLADDLYKLNRENVHVKEERFTPQELEQKFEKARSFIIQAKSVRQLELISTLHWLRTVAGLLNKNASLKLKEIKSANEDEVNDTNLLVDELCQLSQN